MKIPETWHVRISVNVVFIIKLATSAIPTKPTNKTNLVSRLIDERTCQKLLLTSPVHTILTWNDFFSLEHFGAGDGTSSFDGCIYSNCELWHCLDLDLILPYDEYDAIVFHGIVTSISTTTDLPVYRSPHQRYNMVIHESPATRSDLYNIRNFFNWTVSYRRDSDVFVPLVSLQRVGVQYPKDPPNLKEVWKTPIFRDMKDHIPEIIYKISKLAVAFVSNPTTESKREVYIEELSKYIQVDIYGWGRKLTCEREDPYCDLMLDTKYKFYLAFENSLCKDYITEKLHRGLNHYVVPIVYGGADYKDFAPPLSYIDVKDFGSPKDLAKYLLYLDENTAEYDKFFWWKRFYEVHGVNIWCDLCMEMNRPNAPHRVYPDMNLWWNSPEMCISPEEYFSQNLYRSIYIYDLSGY